MSQAFNPYQPPQALDAIVLAQTSEGLWRDGNLLVMHRNAMLPDRCLKSNLPAERRLKRKIYWHHPAIYLVLLVNLLVYAILASILSQRATIEIGLTQYWFKKRRLRMLIAWTLVLIGIGTFFGGFGLENRDLMPWFILSGLFLTLGAAIYGAIACRLVQARRMDAQYIWLKGVHPDFLADLPPWPYGNFVR